MFFGHFALEAVGLEVIDPLFAFEVAGIVVDVGPVVLRTGKRDKEGRGPPPSFYVVVYPGVQFISLLEPILS